MTFRINIRLPSCGKIQLSGAVIIQTAAANCLYGMVKKQLRGHCPQSGRGKCHRSYTVDGVDHGIWPRKGDLMAGLVEDC